MKQIPQTTPAPFPCIINPRFVCRALESRARPPAPGAGPGRDRGGMLGILPSKHTGLLAPHGFYVRLAHRVLRHLAKSPAAVRRPEAAQAGGPERSGAPSPPLPARSVVWPAPPAPCFPAKSPAARTALKPRKGQGRGEGTAAPTAPRRAAGTGPRPLPPARRPPPPPPAASSPTGAAAILRASWREGGRGQERERRAGSGGGEEGGEERRGAEHRAGRTARRAPPPPGQRPAAGDGGRGTGGRPAGAGRGGAAPALPEPPPAPPLRCAPWGRRRPPLPFSAAPGRGAGVPGARAARAARSALCQWRPGRREGGGSGAARGGTAQARGGGGAARPPPSWEAEAQGACPGLPRAAASRRAPRARRGLRDSGNSGPGAPAPGPPPPQPLGCLARALSGRTRSPPPCHTHLPGPPALHQPFDQRESCVSDACEWQ